MAPTDAVRAHPGSAVAGPEVRVEVSFLLDQARVLMSSVAADCEFEKSAKPGVRCTPHWELNQRVGAAVRLAQAAQIMLGGDGRR